MEAGKREWDVYICSILCDINLLTKL